MMRARRMGLVMLTGVALAVLSLASCHTVFDGEIGTAIGCTVADAYGIPHCPAGHTCIAGVCSSVGVPFGSTCTSDEECRQPAYCFQPADVGLNGEGRCARNCCSSHDCGPPSSGQVCYSPPDGTGSICWPAAELELGALGEGQAGEPCKAASECRSGACDRTCIDSCCDDSYCDGDKVCRIKITELSQRPIWSCATASDAPMSTDCNDAGDCYQGLCIEMESDLSFCAEPCCSSSQCGTRLVITEQRPVACAPFVDGDGQVLRACSRMLPVGATGPVGSSCDGDEQCRSGLCLDDGYCSDTCCRDADCGDIMSFSCRAHDTGDTWALRCVRK